THAEDAGDHTSGLGPSTDSFQPAARADIAAPEDLDVTITCTHRPPAVGPVCSYVSAICVTTAAFSDDAVMNSCRQFPGFGRDEGPAAPLPLSGPNTPRRNKINRMPSTTAMTWATPRRA